MNSSAKIILSLLLTVVSSQAWAGEPPNISQLNVPGTISYQGRLQTPEGVDYTNGIYEIDFQLFDAEANGTALWGAKYKPYVYNGFFSVILGQTNVGQESLPDVTYGVSDLWKAVWVDPSVGNTARYLELTVHEGQNNQPLTDPKPSFPRQQLLSSPFAIQAEFARRAQDFDVTGNLQVDGNISGSRASYSLKLESATDWVEVNDSLHVFSNLFVEGSIYDPIKTYIHVDDDIVLNQVLAFEGTTAEIRPGSNGKVDVTGNLNVTGTINGLNTLNTLVMKINASPDESNDFQWIESTSHTGPTAGLWHSRKAEYEIQFSILNLFSKPPAVFVTPISQDGHICSITQNTSGMVVVKFVNEDGAPVDTHFSIMLIGK